MRISDWSSDVCSSDLKLALRKLPPVKIEWVDPTLAVEDVLEMVQAGIFHLTIVEQPIAKRWSKLLPKLRFDRQVLIATTATSYLFSRHFPHILAQTINRFLPTSKYHSNKYPAVK